MNFEENFIQIAPFFEIKHHFKKVSEKFLKRLQQTEKSPVIIGVFHVKF